MERLGSRWGAWSQVPAVRACSRRPRRRKRPYRYRRPPHPLARGASRSPPRLFPVACTELLAARRCWVRPALSEKFSFSSDLRKGLCALRSPRGFSRMVPSGARPDRLLCAQRLLSLSSTATRASPLRVRGGITRGTEPCRPAAVRGSLGEIGFRWQVAGKGPCTRPRVRYPPHHEGRRVTGGFGRAVVGSRSHPPPRFPRAFRRVCVPPARVHVPAALAARSCRVWCVPRALGRERLSPRPPPDHGSVSTAGGLAGALLPPSTGLRRVRDSRGWPRSRGRTLFLGERRSAASGASSDVGTRSAAAAASRAAAGGSVRGESRPARWTGERLSGCRLSDGSVGLLAEGASAGGPSGPAVLWEGVRRGRLPGLPRWAPGRRVEPARVPRCGGGGSGRCLFPPRSPEARPPSLGGLSPPLSPSRGVKVARRPPPLLLRLSA